MREVMRWPWWFSLLVLGLDLSIVIALWAGLGNIAALIGLVSTVAISVFFYQFTSLSIQVVDDVLRIGRAKIDKRFLGKVEILDREKMQYFMRQGFNPRAFYSVRFWIKSGIKIDVNDPRDPTPYWVASSKRAVEIAKLLEI